VDVMALRTGLRDGGPRQRVVEVIEKPTALAGCRRGTCGSRGSWLGPRRSQSAVPSFKVEVVTPYSYELTRGDSDHRTQSLSGGVGAFAVVLRWTSLVAARHKNPKTDPQAFEFTCLTADLSQGCHAAHAGPVAARDFASCVVAARRGRVDCGC